MVCNIHDVEQGRFMARLDMKHTAIQKSTIQKIYAWIFPLSNGFSLSVAYVARSRQRTNKISYHSCMKRPRVMALHTYVSKRIFKNITGEQCGDIIALAQAIWMAQLDMQLISIKNLTIPKIHAWIFPLSDCCRCHWPMLHEHANERTNV